MKLMAALTSPSFVAFCTCLWILVQTGDQQLITVKTGDDVTLQCLDHRGGDIELLEWTRHDQNVFVWKHGTMCEDHQHPSFKNRVELRDPEMKDGDISVILKNVNINDTGTYECRVKNNTDTQPQSITIITLMITGGDKDGGDKDGEDKDGHIALLIILSVVAVVAIVCFLIYSKRNRLSELIFYKPPVKTAEPQLL